MEFTFEFVDLYEAKFVADLLDESSRKHVRSGPGDDRPELLLDLAARLRRFVRENTPKDDDPNAEIPF
jgi:hypothetical protein